MCEVKYSLGEYNKSDRNEQWGRLTEGCPSANLIGSNWYGEKIEKVPLQIVGLKYSVIITKEHIKIGCECHKAEEWKKFDNSEIIRMDGKEALVWWNDNKDFVFMCHERHLN